MSFISILRQRISSEMSCKSSSSHVVSFDAKHITAGLPYEKGTRGSECQPMDVSIWHLFLSTSYSLPADLTHFCSLSRKSLSQLRQHSLLYNPWACFVNIWITIPPINLISVIFLLPEKPKMFVQVRSFLPEAVLKASLSRLSPIKR